MFMSHMKAAPVEAEVQKTEEELAEEEEQRLQLLKMEERLKKISQSEHGTPSPEEVEEEEEELSSDDDKEVHDDDENDEDDVANALASNAAVMNFAKMFSNVKVVKPIEAVRQRINRDTTHFEKIKRAEYGLNIGTLRGWKAERMAELERDEVSRQEIAVSKVGSFMDAIVSIVRIQTWFRMKHYYFVFQVYRAERRALRAKCFYGWKRYIQAYQMRLNILVGKPFLAWKGELTDSKRLKFLVYEFFQMSISRLRLTPQAVMCFFSATADSDISSMISENDAAKVRRLILKTLFRGWCTEIRAIKALQFKASQIICRMMRRTRGAMWSREAVLICFHMWHRYLAVKRANLRNEPDPVFNNPILPQWNALMQMMLVQRIHRRKTAEVGYTLATTRMFRRWAIAMTMDRSQSLNPETRANLHYAGTLSRRVIRAWFYFLRERGKTVRRRDKCFELWAAWAPANRKYRKLSDQVEIWDAENRQKKAYSVMKATCYEVISKRATAVKLIRQNICNRKLMVAAYAFAGLDAHVMMLDCWRRWWMWYRGRWRWKHTLWQEQILWFTSKARAILVAWREYAVGRVSTRNHFFSKQGRRAPLMRSDSFTEPEISMVKKGPSQQQYASSSRHVEETTTSLLEDLFPNVGGAALALFERAQKNILEAKPDAEAFEMFCLAAVHSAHSTKRRKMEKLNALRSTKSGEMSDMGKEEIKELEHWDKHQQMLQTGLDTFDLCTVISAIDHGAVVETSHVRQLITSMGDEHLSLFGYLLRNARIYVAERIAHNDRKLEVLKCSSPLSGILLSTHLDRWDRREISQREINSLINEGEMADSMASSFQTTVTWRTITLLLFRYNADMVQKKRKPLLEDHSIDEEVADVLLKNKISRLLETRQGLKRILGLPHNSQNDNLRASVNTFINPYRLNVFSNNKRVKHGLNDWAKELDIYGILKEYAFLTGKLTKEALLLRTPMLQRDDILLRNGFLKNARKDFHNLRQHCLTPQEVAKAAAKKRSEARKRAVAEAKRAKKIEAKAMANGASGQLLALMNRGKEPVLMYESDIAAEKVFKNRTAMYKNMIAETWVTEPVENKFDRTEEEEETYQVVFDLRRKEAANIYLRLIHWINASSANFPEPSSLPSSDRLTATGLSGYIWKLGLLAEAAKHHDGAGAVVPPSENMPYTCSMMKVFFRWLPSEWNWWSVGRLSGCVKEELAKVYGHISANEKVIQSIAAGTKARTKQKAGYLHFLKSGRAEVVAIGEKISKVAQGDKLVMSRLSARVAKCTRQMSKHSKRILLDSATVSKCELFLVTNKVREMMAMLSVKVPDNDSPDAMAAMRYKAYGLIEGLKNDIIQHRAEIASLEERKAEYMEELQSLGKQSADSIQIFSTHASERFGVIMNAQSLVSNLVAEGRTNEEKKKKQAKLKEMYKVYADILETFIPGGNHRESKPPKTPGKHRKSQHGGGPKGGGEDKDGDDDSESDSDEESEEESENDFSRRTSDDDDDSLLTTDDPLPASSKASLDQSDAGSLEVDSLDDNVDSSSSSEDENDGVLGFGRKSAQSSLFDQKLKDRDQANAMLFRRQTHTEKADEAAALALIEAEKAKADAMQEHRMKIFDEYWLSLGEDSGKVKRMKKKKMREAAIKKAADEEEKEARRTVIGKGKTTSMWQKISSRQKVGQAMQTIPTKPKTPDVVASSKEIDYGANDHENDEYDENKLTGMWMLVPSFNGPDARACCISMKKNVDAELLNDMSKVQMDESGLVGPVQKRPKKYVKPVAPILKGHLAGTSIRSVKNTNKGVKSNSNAPITADATITKDDPFLVSAQIAMPVFKEPIISQKKLAQIGSPPKPSRFGGGIAIGGNPFAMPMPAMSKAASSIAALDIYVEEEEEDEEEPVFEQKERKSSPLSRIPLSQRPMSRSPEQGMSTLANHDRDVDRKDAREEGLSAVPKGTLKHELSRGESLGCDLTAPPLQSLSPFVMGLEESAELVSKSGTSTPVPSSVRSSEEQGVNGSQRGCRAGSQRSSLRNSRRGSPEVINASHSSESEVSPTEWSVITSPQVSRPMEKPAPMLSKATKPTMRTNVSASADSDDADDQTDVSLPFPISFIRVTQSSGTKPSQGQPSPEDKYTFSPSVSPKSIGKGAVENDPSTSNTPSTGDGEDRSVTDTDTRTLYAGDRDRLVQEPSTGIPVQRSTSPVVEPTIVLEAPPLIPVNKLSRIASQKSLSASTLTKSRKKDGCTAVLLNGQWILQTGGTPQPNHMQVEASKFNAASPSTLVVEECGEIASEISGQEGVTRIPGLSLVDSLNVSTGMSLLQPRSPVTRKASPSVISRMTDDDPDEQKGKDDIAIADDYADEMADEIPKLVEQASFRRAPVGYVSKRLRELKYPDLAAVMQSNYDKDDGAVDGVDDSEVAPVLVNLTAPALEAPLVVEPEIIPTVADKDISASAILSRGESSLAPSISALPTSGLQLENTGEPVNSHPFGLSNDVVQTVTDIIGIRMRQDEASKVKPPLVKNGHSRINSLSRSKQRTSERLRSTFQQLETSKRGTIGSVEGKRSAVNSRAGRYSGGSQSSGVSKVPTSTTKSTTHSDADGLTVEIALPDPSVAMLKKVTSKLDLDELQNDETMNTENMLKDGLWPPSSYGGRSDDLDHRSHNYTPRTHIAFHDKGNTGSMHPVADADIDHFKEHMDFYAQKRESEHLGMLGTNASLVNGKAQLGSALDMQRYGWNRTNNARTDSKEQIPTTQRFNENDYRPPTPRTRSSSKVILSPLAVEQASQRPSTDPGSPSKRPFPEVRSPSLSLLPVDQPVALKPPPDHGAQNVSGSIDIEDDADIVESAYNVISKYHLSHTGDVAQHSGQRSLSLCSILSDFNTDTPYLPPLNPENGNAECRPVVEPLDLSAVGEEAPVTSNIEEHHSSISRIKSQTLQEYFVGDGSTDFVASVDSNGKQSDQLGLSKQPSSRHLIRMMSSASRQSSESSGLLPPVDSSSQSRERTRATREKVVSIPTTNTVVEIPHVQILANSYSSDIDGDLSAVAVTNAEYDGDLGNKNVSGGVVSVSEGAAKKKTHFNAHLSDEAMMDDELRNMLNPLYSNTPSPINPKVAQPQRYAADSSAGSTSKRRLSDNSVVSQSVDGGLSKLKVSSRGYDEEGKQKKHPLAQSTSLKTLGTVYGGGGLRRGFVRGPRSSMPLTVSIPDPGKTVGGVATVSSEMFEPFSSQKRIVSGIVSGSQHSNAERTANLVAYYAHQEAESRMSKEVPAVKEEYDECESENINNDSRKSSILYSPMGGVKVNRKERPGDGMRGPSDNQVFRNNGNPLSALASPLRPIVDKTIYPVPNVSVPGNVAMSEDSSPYSTRDSTGELNMPSRGTTTDAVPVDRRSGTGDPRQAHRRAVVPAAAKPKNSKKSAFLPTVVVRKELPSSEKYKDSPGVTRKKVKKTVARRAGKMMSQTTETSGEEEVLDEGRASSPSLNLLSARL